MNFYICKDLCIGCESCVGVCPVGALKMVEVKQLDEASGEEKVKKVVDWTRGTCIECRSCDGVCPNKAYVITD